LTKRPKEKKQEQPPGDGKKLGICHRVGGTVPRTPYRGEKGPLKKENLEPSKGKRGWRDEDRLPDSRGGKSRHTVEGGKGGQEKGGGVPGKKNRSALAKTAKKGAK